MLGLLNLPTEIQQKIFIQVPHELRQTCRSFVVMYNDLFMNMFISKFGEMGMKKIQDVLPALKDYIRSFDYWRGAIRKIIERNYDLKDTNDVNSKYVRDSWKLIYGVFTNRRFYVDYLDYDVETTGIMNTVNVNKSIELIPGLYNCSIGVIIKDKSALNTTSIKITDQYGTIKLDYVSPSHLSDLLPHDKFILLDLGDFEVKSPEVKIQDIEAGSEKQVDSSIIKMDLQVKELNVLVKSSYILCFIDINMYQDNNCYFDLTKHKLVSKNERFWFAWWIVNQEPKVSNVVNTLLKRLYRSIDNEDVSSEDIDSIDIDTYNQKFYSKFNEHGELLVRQFGFTTPKSRRRYMEWQESLEQKSIR
ncbi:hypothetical protein CANINC_002360, partial [Pichia inconspicua]